FSDANSMFAPDAIRALVRPFADPAVGGAAGDQRYLRGGAAGALAQGERGYWGLDRMLKRGESGAGNVISATGAVYAVRRGLAASGPVYALAAIGQIVFYGLAAAGLALRGRPIARSPLLAFPAFFCLVNIAALHAATNVVRGRRIDRWQPQRAAVGGREVDAA